MIIFPEQISKEMNYVQKRLEEYTKKFNENEKDEIAIKAANQTFAILWEMQKLYNETTNIWKTFIIEENERSKK